MTLLDPFVAGFLLDARCVANRRRAACELVSFCIALTTDARSFTGVPFASAFC